jgi:hypothetical protein
MVRMSETNTDPMTMDTAMETMRSMLDISAEVSQGWDPELVMNSLAKTRNHAAAAGYWTEQMAADYDLLREALCYLAGNSGYRDRGW